MPEIYVSLCQEVFRLLDLKYEKKIMQFNGWKIHQFKAKGIFGIRDRTLFVGYLLGGRSFCAKNSCASVPRVCFGPLDFKHEKRIRIIQRPENHSAQRHKNFREGRHRTRFVGWKKGQEKMVTVEAVDKGPN